MYLNESIEKDKFLAGRYNYARMGGTMFRDVLGDKWENSEERRYVNALLKNINEYTAFDINSSTNLTLKSFAAFFQKGDIEMRKLEDYLTSSGIGDFRMAFSLWGVVFGFADMPKTYTTHLFDSAEQEYIEAIYKFIYKSLFGKDLEGSICPYVEPKDDEPKSTLGRFIEGVVDIATRPFIGKNEDAKKYPEALACVFESDEFGSLSSAAKQHYKKACIECWRGQIDELFIACVQGIKPMAKTKGKWEKCVKILKQQLPSKPRTRKKTRDCNNGLFNFDLQPSHSIAPSPIRPLIVDTDIEVLKRLIVEKCRVYDSEIIKNFVYVYDKHQRSERSNNDTIRHFRNLCFPKNPANHGSIEDTPANRRAVDAIVEWLQNNFRN